MTVEGYLTDFLIVHGSITKAILVEWLERDVLPYCNPYNEEDPKERSVIVLDNASAHRSHEVREACARAGVKLLYLPPYSPDFNPIELTFNTLKAWIRRWFELSEGFDDWADFLQFTIEQSGCDKAAPAYYKNAYITEELYMGGGEWE